MGAFVDILKRNNEKIRSDRAKAIHENAEIAYKRKIEDLKLNLKRLNMDRENLLDLSGNNVHGIIAVSDFDSNNFVEKEMNIGIKIRNTEIQLEISEKRYNILFGGK